MASCASTSRSDVLVGVHVYAEPDGLLATLAALAPYEILLLGDGPDAETRRALDALPHAQSTTDDARGAPACFNRLAAHNSARVIVFLESGAVVEPHCIERLLEALDDPHTGLAGPSTNRAWNEQGRPAHDDAPRTLEPLYSLGDFCVAVRREVLGAIDGADEAYGRGPCWEMDFNIRAARAGWKGVWVPKAFVHRAPFPARRRADEAALFEKNKRLYQDRFCGARLRGEKHDYRSHCRGDACPNFAPRTAGFQAAGPQASSLRVSDTPLVTCIMPTFNRREFIRDALDAFLCQTYARRELVIVDDGTDPIADLIPRDDRIRYIRLDARRSIGAKRNAACAAASGEIIAHWDDDDWYPSWRLERQVQVLRENGADLCGTSTLYFLDAGRQRAWRYRYSSAVKWIAGSTFVYTKEFWKRSPFADRDVGEDSELVWRQTPRTLHDLADPQLCVATIHASNTAAHKTNGAFWHPHAIDEVLALMRADEVRSGGPSLPLVSCIMPTYNRRLFVPRAIELFARQDYAHRELVIVDDGEESVGDLAANVPNVRYVRLTQRHTIGAKRNLACARSRGEIIAHWDDDDWYASSRLTRQIEPILAGAADITALDSTCVHEVATGVFWSPGESVRRRAFYSGVHGGTLVYRRAILRSGVAYPDVSLAEDAMLLRGALARGFRLERVENDGLFVYVRHDANAWREFKAGSFIDAHQWTRTSPPAGYDG